MSYHYYLGIIAGVLAFAQAIPYIYTILKGRTKPSRVAYSIFAMSGAVQAASYVAVGASTTIWVNLVIIATTCSIFLLSLSPKYGFVKPWTTMDKIYIAITIVAIMLWIFLGPVFALYLSLTVTIAGCIPIVHKSYLHPETENLLSWSMYLAACAFNVAALTTIAPSIALLPATSFIMALAIVLAMIYGKRAASSQTAALQSSIT